MSHIKLHLSTKYTNLKYDGKIIIYYVWHFFILLIHANNNIIIIIMYICIQIVYWNFVCIAQIPCGFVELIFAYSIYKLHICEHTPRISLFNATKYFEWHEAYNYHTNRYYKFNTLD